MSFQPPSDPTASASGAPTFSAIPDTYHNPFAGSRPWTRGIESLGSVVVALVVGQALLQVVSIWINTRKIGMPNVEQIQALIDLEDVAAPLAVLDWLMYLATVVVFLIWLHRVWTSERSNPRAHELSSGMAVGGWFIPFANLYYSFRTVKELWNGVASARPGEQGAYPRTTTHPQVLGWYCSFVAMNLTAVVARSAEGINARSLDADAVFAALRDAYSTDRIADVFGLLACVVFIVLILRIQGMAKR